MIRKHPKPRTCNCGYHGIYFGKKCGKCRQKAWNTNRVKNRKPTGQPELFKQIWESRPHYSEVSGKFLGDEINVCFFSHILPKGSYPKFMLKPENIMLKTFAEHQAWGTKQYELKDKPEWKHVFELKQKLLNEYPK